MGAWTIRKRLGALIVAVVFAGAGCNHVATLSYAPAQVPPSPPGTTVPPTLPDGSGVVLNPVPGTPTTTLPAVRGGTATITGTVLGPAGAVAGATVLAERVVDGAVGSLTAVTGPDGTFSLGGIQGGDYRVRAWQPPTLAMTDPVVFFLGATDIHPLTLTLSAYANPAVVGVVNPDPPVAGQPANLAVQVTMPTVGDDGVVANPPLSGAVVALANGPGWDILSGQDQAVTGNNGEAIFELRCGAAGPEPLDAAVNGQTPLDLRLPACVAPPPPTTAAAPTSTTAAAPTSTTATTSTSPGGGTASTTTSPHPRR